MNENANRKTALSALGVVLFMGSMAWASVPLYDLFCRVTGYGGYTNVSDVVDANLAAAISTDTNVCGEIFNIGKCSNF